jgi:hypothetical protein
VFIVQNDDNNNNNDNNDNDSNEWRELCEKHEVRIVTSRDVTRAVVVARPLAELDQDNDIR